MPVELSIAIVGDFNAKNETHRATNEGISHAARRPGLAAEARWVPTTDVEEDTAGALSGAAAYLIAPGSPYESMHGALEAIRIARESGVPLLGTCGGFQHIVIEYARNVLGSIDAQHAEYDPYASNLFVTPLSCSLSGQTMSIGIKPGSRAGDFYGALTVEERYYCNFGLNPAPAIARRTWSEGRGTGQGRRGADHGDPPAPVFRRDSVRAAGQVDPDHAAPAAPCISESGRCSPRVNGRRRVELRRGIT